MLRMSQYRYEHEQQLPFHHYVGLTQEHMRSLLRGQRALVLGCSLGGTAVAYVENYALGTLEGLDVEDRYIEAAKLYTANQFDKEKYHFTVALGEDLPFKNACLDAIITHDTLEHVYDVKATLRECYRVLRDGGLMFAVFPSYYHPDANHIRLVTFAYCLHWFFRERDIRAAYEEVIAERGGDASWYAPNARYAMKRRRFNGVNGLSAGQFRRLAGDVGFVLAHRSVKPVLGIGRRTVNRHPWLKFVSLPLLPLTHLPFAEEFLLHRVSYVLQKPPATWLDSG